MNEIYNDGVVLGEGVRKVSMCWAWNTVKLYPRQCVACLLEFLWAEST